MNHGDGSARPPMPPNADAPAIRQISRWEDDESLLTPLTAEQVAAYDEVLRTLLAGEIIQPRCMCGKWASIGECPDCTREYQLIQDEAELEARNYRERAAWRKFKRPKQEPTA